MNVDEIVQQLKQQRSRLDAAIQALEGVSGRGRPPGSTRRPLSPAARKRISQTMKQPWAERKKKAKK
jgi:hypothetical protein